eukprot:m.57586 g.57586  ORF g.57586 m.57586 type:complete len:459 (-) comp13736_c0_seq1:135-1511(-)
MSQLLVASSMSHNSSDPSNGHAYSANDSPAPRYDDFSLPSPGVDAFQPSFGAHQQYDSGSYPIVHDDGTDPRYDDARASEGQQPGKLFIGGLSPETTRDRLLEYFLNFGDVVDCVVMTDAATGRTRGFGFVTFRDSRSCDHVLQKRPHVIDGREVDPKTAVPRQDMDSPRAPREVKRKPRSTSFTHHIRKCFVGGLPTTVTQEILQHFFSQFGPVEEAVIIHDKQTRLPRGFGFVTFVDSATADRVVKVHYHDFFGKMVEVKRAEPKVDMSRSPTRFERRGHSYDPRLTSPGPEFHYYGAMPGHHHHSHAHDRQAAFEGRRRSSSARALLEEPAFLRQPAPPIPDPMLGGRARSRTLQPSSPWGDPFTEQYARAEQAVDNLVNTGSQPPPAASSNMAAIWGLSDQFGSLGLGPGPISPGLGPPAPTSGASQSRREEASDSAFLQGLAQGQQAWAGSEK